jgi:predicted DNA-binding protein with PD1-like motif
VGRLLPGTDLIGGITKICEQYDIKTGVVTTAIGSLHKAVFKYLVPNPELKMRAGYSDPYEMDGPIEFCSGMGLICQNEKGETNVHFHGVFNTSIREGYEKVVPDYVYGGHVVEGKNPVAATLDLMILELKGVEIVRKYDEETEIPTKLDINRKCIR